MKLWHDDIRRPPDNSWTWWARTNKEAMLILLTKTVTEMSMDHDLGLHGLDLDAYENPEILRGESPDGDGYDLALSMYHLKLIPPKVTIHSWNVDRAEWMAAVLREGGGEVEIKAYEHPDMAILEGNKRDLESDRPDEEQTC